MSTVVDFSKELTDRLVEAGMGVNQDILTKIVNELTTKFNIEKRIENLDGLEDLLYKIDLFLESKRIEGIGSLTLKGYRYQLIRFANFLKIKTTDINVNDIRRYIVSLGANKSSTMCTIISVLKTFFVWLVDEKIIVANPMDRIVNPKVPKRLPKALSIDEIELLREKCTNLRERAILEFFYSTGTRVGEVVNIKISDVNLSTRTLKVIGKGDKERNVFLNFKTVYYLRKYLSSRKDRNEYLFVTCFKDSKKMSIKATQDIFSKLGKKAGLAHKLHPHIMRHTMASTLVNNGVDLSSIQELMGHADPKTTQIYCQVTQRHVREQYERFGIQ